MMNFPTEEIKEDNQQRIAYIRRDVINNHPVWSLREENGELLAYAEDKEVLKTAVDEKYTLVMAH